MPADRPSPAPVRTAAQRFFPWVRPAAKGLRSGPVNLVGLSSRTAISRATSCTVNPPIVSRGSRPLCFTAALRIASRTGWRIVRTELRIGRAGCFRITATGRGLRETIPLAVPGPDYGTSGW